MFALGYHPDMVDTNIAFCSDPDILFVGDVDHSWLFPKCKAAVIHGGAGKTHDSNFAANENIRSVEE